MLMQLPASSCFRRSTRTLSGSGIASAPSGVPPPSRPRELLERAEASEVTRLEVTEEREVTAAAGGARGCCCPLLPEPEVSSPCGRLAWAAAAASLACCNEVRPLDMAFSA